MVTGPSGGHSAPPPPLSLGTLLPPPVNLATTQSLSGPGGLRSTQVFFFRLDFFLAKIIMGRLINITRLTLSWQGGGGAIAPGPGLIAPLLLCTPPPPPPPAPRLPVNNHELIQFLKTEIVWHTEYPSTNRRLPRHARIMDACLSAQLMNGGAPPALWMHRLS